MINTLVERSVEANGSVVNQTGQPTRRRKKTGSNGQKGAAKKLAPSATVQRKLEQAIEAQASVELRKSSYHAVRSVSCEVRGCVLILRGRVPNFYMKQIAQTVLRQLLPGNFVIENQLEVD